MFGLSDIQYLYEFLFWLIIFLILRIVWHKPKVRLGYAFVVAGFNLFAIIMYTLSSVSGQMDPLTSFSFAFFTRYGLNSNAYFGLQGNRTK
jgi:hypothetical protein